MKEGSFDGEMSNFDFDQDIQAVKTPDQIPERVDLSQVPPNVLRSGVIESLISQNDDLMSRLTVSLRRIAILEEKLVDARNGSAQFKAKYDNLKDQILILREQSRILSERTRSNEEKQNREDQDTSQLREQIQLLEIRYAELYTSTQKRQQLLKNDLLSLSLTTDRYKKYRRNIRQALAPLRADLATLRQKSHSQESTLQDLRQNLSETTNYISEQAKEHKNQISNLTNEYEHKLRDLNTELETLSEKNNTLHARAKDAEHLYSEKVKLENDLIIAQRKEEVLQIQNAAELSDVQKALARYRNEAKELALSLEGKGQEYAEKTVLCENLTGENAALGEQVETLQLLWRDQQNQIEKLSEQKNSLQKLNQELSIAINEYRRDIRDLKEKIDSEQLKAAELATQQQAINDAKDKIPVGTKSSKNEPTSAPIIPREDKITPQILEKIDKALTNLHGGR